VAQCTAELQRRRDTILEALPGVPIVRPGGGWSLLIDTQAIGLAPADASRALLAQGVAATPMTGWGGDVAARPIRFVFSAEPVERLRELGDRLGAAGLSG
jgi:aspartate/methionine/tyrosine aminotransferase